MLAPNLIQIPGIISSK
jgi:plastocyanin